MKYLPIPGILLILILLTSFADQDSRGSNPESKERYSLVKVFLSSADEIARLTGLDISADHYTGRIQEGIELTLNSMEMERLKASGIAYSVMIHDLDEYYKNREMPSPAEMQNARRIAEQDNVEGFSYGSMGGYFTYSEVVQKLDSFRLRFPNLITPKTNLGNSVEGREIWAVKISDNPELNESSTEAPVYFDALHHAREPQSMASLMYFMYWILENYGTDPEATYLINNREIFIVPVVNPDGYVYNQTTNPNGGGSWRKNRRNNGSGCYGVDLNRNYPYGWGVNSGSSNDPCSETYRGASAGSEPEAQAVINFLQQIRPKISFSYHSVAGRYLNPYGYNDSAVKYEVYSEFSSDFSSKNNYTYGTVNEMLSYYSSGTTRDYLHSIGSYCWTPEVGGVSFWPAQSVIIPVASENLYPTKYLCWVAGAFADMQDYEIPGKGYVTSDDTLLLKVKLKNKGLSQTSKNVTVQLTTDYPNSVPLVSTVNYDSIQPWQSKTNTEMLSYRILSNALYMDEMRFFITVRQEGVVTSFDTVRITVGRSVVLASDNAENGISRWIRSGTGTMWDTTFIDPLEGEKNFADSRYGNARNSSNNYFTFSDTISLIGTLNPRIEFTAKWAMESTYDYIRLQVSTNFGTSWINLPGRFTRTISGQPSYSDINHWRREQINLNPYAGQLIRVRFNFVTDGGVPGDGIYVDRFRVVDYRQGLTQVSVNASELPLSYSLGQNYPNPFNPSTKITFDIPSAAGSESRFVELIAFDIAGREVRKIISADLQSGRYTAEFGGSDLPGGVYFYSLYSDGVLIDTKRAVLLK